MTRKLSDSQILRFERWAKEKSKHPLAEEEKFMVQEIEKHQKNNWEGIRDTEGKGKVIDFESATRELDRLKRKGR